MSNNKPHPPLRLHRLPLCPPFVTFEKFVVFQIHSPPSEGSGEVPSTLSSVSSLYVFTIRAISDIRSFSYIVPSSLSNNQSPTPLRLHRLPLCPSFEKFEKFVVFQIKSPPPCQIISPRPPFACTVSLSVHHS